MTKKIGRTVRNQIADIVPFAMGKAISSYRYFLNNAVKWEEISKFKDAHGACKTAIAHIELLLKLAEWADKPDEDAEERKKQKDLEALLDSAKAETARLDQNSRGERDDNE